MAKLASGNEQHEVILVHYLLVILLLMIPLGFGCPETRSGSGSGSGYGSVSGAGVINCTGRSNYTALKVIYNYR